jgi:hypothetical protein
MQHGLQLINDTLGCLSRIGPRKLSDFQLIRSFNDSATHNLVRRHMDGFPAVSFQKGKYNAMGTSSPGSQWRSSSNSSLSPYLLEVNPQDDINPCVVVKFFHRLRIAYLAFELRIDFIIKIEGKSGEAICAVWARDVGFHRVGVGIGKVNHRAGQRIVTIVQHLSCEQAACRVIVFVIGKIGTRSNKTNQQEHEN